MREILFRAKRIDNGEWVFGGYDHALQTNIKTGFYKDTHFIMENTGLVNVVDPETVCQYTGLTDKNGRKIFEGDIIIVNHADGQGDCTEKTEVFWDEKNASFSPWNWQYQCDGCDLYCEIQSVEVIGNIFDNPELVENNA